MAVVPSIFDKLFVLLGDNGGFRVGFYGSGARVLVVMGRREGEKIGMPKGNETKKLQKLPIVQVSTHLSLLKAKTPTSFAIPA